MMSFCLRFGRTRSSSVARLAPISPVMPESFDPYMNNRTPREATGAHQSWLISATRISPRAATEDAVGLDVGGCAGSPKPRISGATTWKPAAAIAGI
jgi:hypothetical protein